MSKFTILKQYEINLMNIMNLLGSVETDNIQLNKLGKFLFSTRYIGTFQSDQVPKLKKQ